MFSPEKMYGFASSGEAKVFFHQGVFVGGVEGAEHAPPPSVGERVLVDYDGEHTEGQAPKAKSALRLDPPVLVTGIVTTFNAQKGWGFAAGEDGKSFYLHRSEVEDGRLPIEGQQVSFYAGFKRGRPRACYVQVGGLGG